MIRLVSLVAGFAVLATAAQAQDYTVSIKDKSPREVRAAIGEAASKACRDIYMSDFDPLFDYTDCVSEAVHDAHMQLKVRAQATEVRFVPVTESN
jgi:hypothetical protein